jgi:DNA-directed RNA polymerase subunit K/omega
MSKTRFFIEEEEEDLLNLFIAPSSLLYKAVNEPKIEVLKKDFQLTRYEYSKVICKREEQIINGAKTKLHPKLLRSLRTPRNIAVKELELGLVPLKVIRVFPNLTKIQILELYGNKIKPEDIK